MQRGVIARSDGSFGRIDSFARTRSEDGVELTDLVDVQGVKRTPNGVDITYGQAAKQSLTSTESVSLANDEVTVSTSSEVTTKYTDFMAIDDEFVAVKSGSGTFTFDILSDRFDVDLTRADVDLDGFWLSLEDATPWKVGFYGHDGPVENGVVHGESVLDDGVFGSAISELKKNQLGATVELDGDEYKFVVTKSGYLELYRPSDAGAEGFSEFVAEKLLPHTA